MKIPSMSDKSIREAVKAHTTPDGKLTASGAEAVAKAALDGKSVSKTEKKDIEKLLASDLVEPDAKRVLQALIASPSTNTTTTTTATTTTPGHLNPAFAFHGVPATTTPVPPPPPSSTTGAGTVQGPGEPPPAPRPKTLTPPAVIGSTAQSNQTTGPNATPLNFAAHGLIQLWAVPGATIRVYNNSVIENGKPKLIKEITAPMTSNETHPRCMSGAYPTQEAFGKDAQKFMAAKQDGLILVSVPLAPTDDQDAGDTFKVTMQTGARAESDSVSVRLHAYSAFGIERVPTIDTTKLALTGGRLTNTVDYAITPGTRFEVYKDGIETTLGATADENGHLDLDLGALADQSRVSVVAFSRRGKPVELDLSAIGLSSGRPSQTARVTDIEQAVARGFLSEPVNHRLTFDVKGLPDGTALKVVNPNAPGETQTFVSQGGVMKIDVRDVMAGDALSVKLDTSGISDEYGELKKEIPGYSVPGNSYYDRPAYSRLNFEGPEGRSQLTIQGTYVVPEGAVAARFKTVLDVFKDVRQDELQMALDLFGPYPRVQGGDQVSDPVRMRRLFDGAKLGSSAFRDWDASIEHHLKSHGDQNLVDGYKLGVAWRNATRKSLARSLESVGFVKTASGQTSTVITGGYNMLRPHLSSPLRPETVRSPDTYELRFQDLPPLGGLRTGGISPQGWVNPNAIGMVFGMSLSSGATTVDYIVNP